MEITVRDYKRIQVIRIVGRVDATTAPQLDEALKAQIAAGHTRLALEMDATNFLSSAGARALISAQKALKPKGGGVSIAQPSKAVSDVLRLAGFESLFSVYSTTEEAVAA